MNVSNIILKALRKVVLPAAVGVIFALVVEGATPQQAEGRRNCPDSACGVFGCTWEAGMFCEMIHGNCEEDCCEAGGGCE